MNYLYLVLFVLVTAVHLYFSKRTNQYGRGITKGMILLLLLGFYLECVDAPEWLLVIALLFSWLGDLLLLGKGIKWFTAGGISFMISHFFFVLTYHKEIIWSNVPVIVIAVLGIIFAIAVAIIFKKLKQFLIKPIVPPMFLYLLINGCMNCFAWFRLISTPCLGTIITAVGAFLFFISDTALFFVRFNKDSKMKSHFLVMLTYSIAELLIVLGLILA